MMDYERMYFQLAAKVVDVIDILIEAQQNGESDYIEGKIPIFKLINDGPEQVDDNQK